MNPNQNKKNPLVEIVINILLPIMILNKGGAYLGDNGSLKALIIALAFPVGYALYDFIVFKHKNIISVLGVVNLLFTGGFGVMKLGPEWFIVKEAAFPFVLGVMVLVSAFTAKPLIRMLIYNDTVLQIDKVESALEERGFRQEFDKHLKLSTIFFAASFFISSLLNYILAVRIFTKLPTDVTDEIKSEMLNKQIADMTWIGYAVIFVPSLLILSAILWHLFAGIKKYTGYKFEEIIHEQPKK
ncbi:MAG: hypothetical protein H6621_09000 [Halobacteriovoraceae bacterium]|nr:hypothetical protein [Halobacteriovoraceae bacterium]MCB9095191.1 hypothetical protein [Halobacteriovoraceae bacterium]